MSDKKTISLALTQSEISDLIVAVSTVCKMYETEIEQQSCYDCSMYAEQCLDRYRDLRLKLYEV